MINLSSDPSSKLSHDSSDLERKQDSLLSLLSNIPKHPPKKSHLQDLQEIKNKLEKELEEAKTALSGVCQDVDDSKGELEKLKKKNEELANHDELISRRKAELMNDFNLLSSTKLNPHDEELVKKTELQYKCVRNLTQVRFSYTTTDNNNLEGFVFNKVTRNVVSFSINISELDNEQVHQRLLKLMRDVSHPSFSDEPSK